MTIQTYIILNEAQKAAAEALNGEDAAVVPRLIDNPAAGELYGLYVAPARILSDPVYARWHDSLSVLPRQELDSDLIFLPPEEI